MGSYFNPDVAHVSGLEGRQQRRFVGAPRAAQSASTDPPSPAPAAAQDVAPGAAAKTESSRAAKQADEDTKRAAAAKADAARVTATRTRLRFDPDINRVVVQFLDEHGEVTRQIPPEELRKIAVRFRELQGLMFDREV